MTKLQYKFEDGSVVVDTLENLIAIANIKGTKLDMAKISGELPEGYYLSGSKGLLKIREMEDHHLLNSFNKHFVDFLNSIRKDFATHGSLSKYVEEFGNFPDNLLLKNLFKEIENRSELEESKAKLSKMRKK